MGRGAEPESDEVRAVLDDGGRGPASGRCQQLFYCPSLTSLLVLIRPVNKPHSNILDPQGPVPRKPAQKQNHTYVRAAAVADASRNDENASRATGPPRLPNIFSGF